MPCDWPDTAKRNGKLIHETVTNSRIYLPLWRVLYGKFFWRGVKRSTIGRTSRYVPHPSRPTVFTVCFVSQHFAGPECPKFLKRSFLCVTIKGPLKQWLQLAADWRFALRAIAIQLHVHRASPRWITFDIGNAFTAPQTTLFGTSIEI